MSGNPIDETTLESLRFFGTISASFSHEINNVVSIVNELSGLISDYLIASRNGRPVDAAKLKEKNEKITRATKRGAVIIKNYNRFAHSADKPTQTIQVDELLDNFISIIQRIAGLKGVTITFDGREKSGVSLECNPFLVMQALFIIMRDSFDGSGEGTEIKLSASGRDERIHIRIESTAELKISDDENTQSILESLLSAIDGTLESGNTRDNVHVKVLSLPG